MQYTTLGKTGLKVSVAGLGCGGNSRIGQGAGLSEAQSVELVRAARDLGVTFFDTAEVYGTEGILGAALRPSERAEVVISTKSRIARDGKPMTAGEPSSRGAPPTVNSAIWLRSRGISRTGTMAEMMQVDDPWVRSYFHGPRAHAAQPQGAM